jgi:malate dehydrogenase (oxaloacetate-decarboxylating)(NADP+)
MITTSGLALADALDPSEKADSLLYPRLTSERIRQVSAEIALKVVRQAQKQGVDSQPKYRAMSDSDLLNLIQERQWTPSSASEVTTTSKL